MFGYVIAELLVLLSEMPKLKQIPSLVSIAQETLLDYVVQRCKQLGEPITVEEFYFRIARLKNILKDIPSTLFANLEIYNKFLKKFYQDPRETYANCGNAPLAIIFDMNIPDLCCEGQVLATLDRHNAPRLKSLETLDLTYFPDTESKSLERFQLQHITTLKLPTHCTLKHLRIIGQRCLRLRNLDVSNSKKVTDAGLTALRKCSGLACVDISGCKAVTRKGIKEFLSNHTGLKQIHLEWVETDSTDPNEFVHPNIERLGIASTRPLLDQHLRIIAERFPNLTSLKLNNCRCTGDLSLLIPLEQLTEFEFGRCCAFDFDSLSRLLATIGGRITSLKILWYREGLTQNDLNFIFSKCVNIEHFGFSYKPFRASERLDIPTLPKLKTLECYLLQIYKRRKVEIILNPMPELKQISYSGFSHTHQTIEAMILSGMNFPELAVIGLNYEINDSQRMESLKDIVRANNIDLIFENYVPPQP
ncbi:uncharacterized protein LOC124310060 isoform X1 [Neodiprion virginianus]|uniref:uncharacterized protein LOC124310060 isoform X1 n=1 Tax=Neodiprion virginianus TaxID=2961670 RepID=UPI001EE77E0C|nr:uncharacterized protein LOC124310060 isoform X1 [Neodiprion virginianus]